MIDLPIWHLHIHDRESTNKSLIFTTRLSFSSSLRIREKRIGKEKHFLDATFFSLILSKYIFAQLNHDKLEYFDTFNHIDHAFNIIVTTF